MYIFIVSGGIHFIVSLRSEQDKEPEKEVVSEVVGTGPSEEATDDGMLLLLELL